MQLLPIPQPVLGRKLKFVPTVDPTPDAPGLSGVKTITVETAMPWVMCGPGGYQFELPPGVFTLTYHPEDPAQLPRLFAMLKIDPDPGTPGSSVVES